MYHMVIKFITFYNLRLIWFGYFIWLWFLFCKSSCFFLFNCIFLLCWLFRLDEGRCCIDGRVGLSVGSMFDKRYSTMQDNHPFGCCWLDFDWLAEHLDVETIASIWYKSYEWRCSVSSTDGNAMAVEPGAPRCCSGPCWNDSLVVVVGVGLAYELFWIQWKLE